MPIQSVVRSSDQVTGSLSLRTCSTRSSNNKNAPKMYRVPFVTRCPPCLTLPGRTVPCPTFIGSTLSVFKKGSSATILFLRRHGQSHCQNTVIHMHVGTLMRRIILQQTGRMSTKNGGRTDNFGNKRVQSGKNVVSSRSLNHSRVFRRFVNQSPSSLYFPEIYHFYPRLLGASAVAMT